MLRPGLGGVLVLLVAGCNAILGVSEFGDAGVAPPILAFEFSTTNADEASHTITLVVRMDRPSEAGVIADYSLGGTAVVGEDYAGSSGRLALAPGETEATIEVTILGDDLEEPEETIEIELANVQGAMLGAASRHTIRISSDILPRVRFATSTTTSPEGTPASIELLLDRPGVTELTVDVVVIPSETTASPADHALTMTPVVIPAGTLSLTLPWSIIDDASDEHPEAISVRLQSPSPGLIVDSGADRTSHTIEDDDPEPTVSVMSTSGSEDVDFAVRVTVSVPSGKAIMVPFTLGSGTASMAEATLLSSSPLALPPGASGADILFRAMPDGIDELDETVVVMLAAPTNATLGTATGMYTLLDQEPTPGASFLGDTFSQQERNNGNDETVMFAVNLSGASAQTITVPFTIGGGTATPNQDYTALTVSPLTFAPGELQKTIQVRIEADNMNEPNETFVMTLQLPTNAVLGLYPIRTVTIVDND